MRALLRDKDDSTLIAIEVSEAVYEPEEQRILLYTFTDTCYAVERIVEANADSLIRMLHMSGCADFSSYPGCLFEKE